MANFIDTLISGITLLLAFLILVNLNKVNVKANQWFGVFILCIFFINLEELLLTSNIKIDSDILLDVLNLPSFIIAPIFFLSVSYFIEPNRKWKTEDFFHFSFAFLIVFFIGLSFLLSPEETKNDVDAETTFIVQIIFNTLFASLVITYCFLSYRKIIKHQKNIRLYNSSIESVDLNWLKYIATGVSIMAVSWVLDIGFGLSEGYAFFDIITSCIYFFGLIFIAYFALKQKEIYPFNNEEKKEINSIILETLSLEENKKKLISDEKLEILKAELIDLMDVQKPFLDCELSLVKLSNQMNLSPHSLSYVINKGFDENFYQFVNRYRIEEAKKVIFDPKMQHLNLVGIAFEVGFNSKTVFNTTFKKLTNLTPSEFKKNNI